MGEVISCHIHIPTRRIIQFMRRLLLALMIVLLPLRGWMGDAMAMEALIGPHFDTELVATNDHFTLGYADFEDNIPQNSPQSSVSGGHGHCEDHADTPSLPTAGAQGASAGHPVAPSDCCHSPLGSACNACQLCHSVAVAADLLRLPALSPPALAPAISLASFSSAVPAPSLKPPIS